MTRWRCVVALVALLLTIGALASGCGGSSVIEPGAAAPPPSDTGSATGPATPPVPSGGPSTSEPSTQAATPSAPPSLSPGDHTITVTGSRPQRSLLLHVPPRLHAARVSLTLVYHGALDTAANTAASTDFPQVSDRNGTLVAFLQGYQDTWNEGAGHTPAEQAGIDDIAFTREALATIARLMPVDTSRVAAVGFSNGALMAQYVGCRLAGSVTLIVPVEGQLPVEDSPGCAPAHPLSVLEVHGTDDQTIPYGGGPFAGIGGGTAVLSAPDSVARWAELNGCSTPPVQTSPESGIRLTAYSGCRGDAHVTLRTIVGGQHAWPAGIGELVAQALG